MKEQVHKIRMVFFYILNKKIIKFLIFFFNLQDVIHEVGIRGTASTCATTEGTERSSSHVTSSVKLSRMFQNLWGGGLFCIITPKQSLLPFLFFPKCVYQKSFKWTISGCLPAELCLGTRLSTHDSGEMKSYTALKYTLI